MLQPKKSQNGAVTRAKCKLRARCVIVDPQAMAAVTPIKPFSPEETRWILDHLQHPAVFLNMTQGWPVLHWTAQHLSGCLQDRLIRFRLGRKEATNAPLFETQCSYIEANVAQFLRWTQHQTDVGSFSEYPCSEYWAYADYKYITTLFHDQPSMFEDVKWSEFGFEGRTGKESTLWIGTQGANTPCHLDTYGCNLVLQVQGRKRWHLFPPEDTAKLYPTRIPYEESSVFSQVHVLRPDPRKFPQFQGARAHTVTLEPGQVLYVPRHWWHYVESIDPITVSVNSWIELEVDDAARVSEAVTRTVVCALKSVPSDDNADAWLNPTEEEKFSHEENMQYLNLAVSAQRKTGLCHSKPSPDPRATQPAKRDSCGRLKLRGDGVRLPFGEHLIPVKCQDDEPEKTVPEDSSGDAAVSPGSDGSAGKTRTCGADLTRFSSCDLAADHGNNQGPSLITTNDLLDCLVHPDIISRVTELLLERHRGGHL
ncbi:PREDICTED: HSPB1-associated protein 1 isoform X1 [Poecilia mexicana]|nr:PREDICTED: HSPB1-associated protein 1 isoform X1 [Poecilia mexicana]